MKRTLLMTNTCCTVLAIFVLLTWNAYAVDIEPPKAQLVDKFGVNMANGQITHSVNTVSIGGATGLAHSVSVVANEFDFKNFKGFRDKYAGQARNVELSSSPNFTPNNIMRVYDFVGSADFAYVSASTGAMLNSGLNMTSGYAYKPLGFDQNPSIGDDRQILEFDNTYFYWTHPDGTVSRFYRGQCPGQSVPCADSPGELVDVTFPNGLVITITSSGMSVTTNTGFQLKAVYVNDTRGLPSNVPDNPNLINAQPVSPTTWASRNPAYIYAVNNAIEYCTALATTCSFTRNWPRAEFHWPGGMPRRVYLAPTNTPNPGTSEPGSVSDDSVWIKDAKGQMTTYYFKPYDLSMDGDYHVPNYPPGVDFSPRIVKIAPYGSQEVLTYDYKNIFGSILGFDTRLSRAGSVISGQRWNQTTTYQIGDNYQTDSINQSGGVGGITKVQVHSQVIDTNTALYFAETSEGRYTFEPSPRNFVTKFEQDYGVGPTLTYTYTRSNLTTISYNNGDSTVVVTYPATCDVSTRKTCNKPLTVKDANGNITTYTYHAASGQVASVTSPPTKNSGTTTVTPVVRYEYTQLSAHYYNGGGSKITGPAIWMKTAERTCINSATPDVNAGSGGCAATNDEVETRYEYNNDNLLMTGMTVTAYDPVSGTTKTLRTCFQYDIYGNQIGKTEPNANLSVCN